jgi:hypothetical protein
MGFDPLSADLHPMYPLIIPLINGHPCQYLISPHLTPHYDTLLAFPNTRNAKPNTPFLGGKCIYGCTFHLAHTPQRVLCK